MAIKGGEFELLLEELRALYGDGDDPSDTGAADAKIAAAANDGAVAKSFTVKLADGTEMRAIDGSDMVKSLTARVENNEGAITKALGQLLDIVKVQAARIDKLARRRQGSAETGTVTTTEFFAKALAGQAAGTVSGFDIARAEACLNHGQPVPPEIVRKVMGDGTRGTTPREMSPGHFFGKALDAQRQGKVCGLDLIKAENAIAAGRQPDPNFVRAVMFGHSGTRA